MSLGSMMKVRIFILAPQREQVRGSTSYNPFLATLELCRPPLPTDSFSPIPGFPQPFTSLRRPRLSQASLFRLFPASLSRVPFGYNFYPLFQTENGYRSPIRDADVEHWLEDAPRKPMGRCESSRAVSSRERSSDSIATTGPARTTRTTSSPMSGGASSGA
jgi:hypothetical protein